MKKSILILTVLMTTLKVNAQEIQQEKEILRNIVEQTFANGALNKLSTDKMKKGFHPDFAILIAKENNLYRLFLKDWVNVVEQYKQSEKQMNSGVRNLNYTIEVLDITEKTAVVKTEFFRKEQLVITDYLSYIKFPEGWKAVAKISHEHIPNPLNLNL
ncbi:MAG: nuclear transport factor 2 family protein [Niabella sp.]